MSFKFGDVLRNHWASKDNPNRHTIFLRYNNKYIDCINYRGAIVQHYKRDHRLEKVDNVSNLELKELAPSCMKNQK